MLKRIYHPGIVRAVRALVPRSRDYLLMGTDTQRNYFRQAWQALIFGLIRSFTAFFALFYLPFDLYSADVASGLIHLMFTLWLLGNAFQLASIIRDELDASESTSFLTILPATGATRVDATVRNQCRFLGALPIELLAWHFIAVFSLGLPVFPPGAAIPLGIAALVTISTSIIVLRFVSKIPPLSTWLNTTVFVVLMSAFVEEFVKERVSLSYGIEDVINFLGKHLAVIGDIIPIGWFFQPSLGGSIHPLQWFFGFVMIGIAAFLLKPVYRKLISRTEQQVAEMNQIDLDLLFLGIDDLDDYFEELLEPDDSPRDSGVARDRLINEALTVPSPDSVLPGNSLEKRFLRRNLDAEDCEILETFHSPPRSHDSSRLYLIRAWILIGLLIAGQFLFILPIKEFWVIFFQMACTIFAIFSLCRSGSGLSAAYTERGTPGNISTTAVLFPVSIQRLSALRLKLACTFSLIHLPPALFVITAYWLFHFGAPGITLILMGGFSFAIFGTSAFLLMQWFSTAILLLKMGRSFFDFTLCASLVVFVTLNFSWFFVVVPLFAYELGESWVAFLISGFLQAAVCAFTYHIGLWRMIQPRVNLCGKREKSFTLT